MRNNRHKKTNRKNSGTKKFLLGLLSIMCGLFVFTAAAAYCIIGVQTLADEQTAAKSVCLTSAEKTDAEINLMENETEELSCTVENEVEKEKAVETETSSGIEISSEIETEEIEKESEGEPAKKENQETSNYTIETTETLETEEIENSEDENTKTEELTKTSGTIEAVKKVLCGVSSLFSEESMMTALEADNSTDSTDWIGTPNSANAWQIVAEGYSGREQSNKEGYDIDNDGLDDFFYQKNVVSTAEENKFQVYLSVTERMTWDELLAECKLGITTSHKYKISSLESSIGGNSSYINPGKSDTGNNYEAVVTFTRNGQTVHTYNGWYNGTTPNCSNATGFIVLEGLGQNLIASTGVNLHNDSAGTGGQLSFTIDLDTMVNNGIIFNTDETLVDSVADSLGDYMIYKGVSNCDGTYSFEESTNVLNWTPVANETAGVQVMEDGKLTGYHYNICQLLYNVELDVTKEGFKSCGNNMNSAVNEAESYEVNKKATLNYTMGTYQGATVFQVPYVRGLLYNVEFAKKDADSQDAVPGAEFTLYESDGTTKVLINGQVASAISDESGNVKFSNLPYGSYVLKETNAPEGYYPIEESFEITLSYTTNASNMTQDTSQQENYKLKNDLIAQNGVVYNTELPANIDIIKTDSEGNKVSGAYFILEKLNSSGFWEQVGEDFEILNDGTIELKELKSGRYRLTEKTAPNGYFLLGKYIYFKIDKSSAVLTDENGNTIENEQTMWTLDNSTETNLLTIKNNEIATLPSTGGRGTYMFTIGGAIVVMTALLMFIKNKRKEGKNA